MSTHAQPTAKGVSAAAPLRGLVLQRKCACGAVASALTGECGTCAKKKMRGVQPKLAVGRPDDAYELEADRVADRVVAAPVHPLGRGIVPQIQRLAAQPGAALASVPASVGRALAGSGQPLEPALRRNVEQRFGRDFSQVRVHTGAVAARSAREISAQAYTVGRDIVFAEGRFEPGTQDGRRLLAHELTHVVQQSGAGGIGDDRHPQTAQLSPAGSAGAAMLQCKGGTFGGFFANIGRGIASIFTDEPGYSQTTLREYLKILDDTKDIEDDYDSDNKARAVVKQWMAGASAFALTQEQKVLLIREMFSGFTGDDDEAAILNLLSASPDAEVGFILGKVSPTELRGEIHGEERDQLESILAGFAARAGPLAPRDIFAGAKPVTALQQPDVEHVLNPTTVIVPAAPVPVGTPPPPPVVADPPAMTGKGPGGAFEIQMLDMLKKNVGGWGAEFRKLRGESGQPAFPIRSANRVADAAQGEAERYFAPYIRVASRGITDKYHPGAYSLTDKLGDESTRPLTDPARRGWMGYWMSLRVPNCYSAPCGQSILDAHNYLGSRDSAELARVRDLYMATAANVTDIDDAIHGWPAEAGSGTVFIQPYQRIPDEDAKRTQRWELFTTLIHEFMHVLMHPNFAAAANIIGGTARKILVEGFAEVMRTELWSGPGQLKSRLPGAELAPLREQVEGKRYDYKESVVKDAGYYDQLADATKIDSKVGHENAKTAFFLGHVELLGLGTGTRTEGGSLAGVAMYEPTDSADAQVVVAVAGDSYAGLLAASGAKPGGLLNDATGAPLPVGAAIAAGTRVRIPGIRWVRAIVNDTLGSVAQQHNVGVAALAAANGFPPGAPATSPLVVGKRILIPLRPKP